MAVRRGGVINNINNRVPYIAMEIEIKGKANNEPHSSLTANQQSHTYTHIHVLASYPSIHTHISFFNLTFEYSSPYVHMTYSPLSLPPSSMSSLTIDQ